MKQSLIEGIILKEDSSIDDKVKIMNAIDAWMEGDPVIYPVDGTPMPWDCDIEYDENTGIITMTGGAAPGGYESGTVTLTTDFDHFLNLFIID